MAKPPSSGWGKLSAGQSYLPWAVDVARAVFSVGLGPNVGVLFWHVLEGSWGGSRKTRNGWPDPVPVQINYAELAALWGMPKQRIYDAKQWLVKSRMLIENEAGLWINKAADQWVKPEDGSPLLTPERLAYAKAGRTRTGKSDQQPPSNGLPLPSNGPTLPASRSTVTGVTVNRYESNGLPLPAPIEERARVGKPNGNEEKAVAAKDAAAAPSIHLDPETPGGVPPLPDRDHDLLNMRPGPHRLTTEEVTRIWRALWTHFNVDNPGARRRLAIEFFEHQERFSFKAWLGALKDVWGRQTLSIGSIGYLARIAADIDAGTHRSSRDRDTIPFPVELRTKPKVELQFPTPPPEFLARYAKG